MTAALTSRRAVAHDVTDAIELCVERGWTERLPVVPPTEPLVRDMLDGAGLNPGREITHIPNPNVSVTAEKAAIKRVSRSYRLAGPLRRSARLWAAAWLVVATACASDEGEEYVNPRYVSRPYGPGLPNLTYASSEVGRPLSVFRSTTGAGVRKGHGNVAMHKGYLAVIYASDSGVAGGGISFYDISDPRSPVLVYRQDRHEIREPHGFGFSNSYGGDYVALQTTSGVQIWDWTNVTAPALVSSTNLGGVIASDYTSGAWWVFWQAPCIYVGGSGNGLFVVNASSPAAPVVAKQMPTSQTGGFRVGPVFAVGNILVASSMDQGGYATFDISDPVNPVLMQAMTNNAAVYSSLLNGDKIVGAGGDGKLYVHDVTNLSNITLVNSSAVAGGKGGYATVQDGYAFVGFSDRFAKIDIRNNASYPIVQTGTSAVARRDEDFATVLGNLVFGGSDHNTGSGLMPHQTAPDTRGPLVNMVSPANNAVSRALSSRVGVSFTDQIDVASVTSATFIVRPVGGAAMVGTYSSQTNIVNFKPDSDLLANTTYEVVIPAGGIKDYAGNGVPTEFRVRFSTGPTISNPLACSVNPTLPTVIKGTASLSATATGTGTKEFSFNFGDGSPATPFGATSTASHAYATVGHYNVRVTVQNGSQTSSCTRVQTIHYPLTASMPTASSTLIYDGSTSLAWVVNPDTDTVTAIDGVANSKRFEVTVGKSPRTLARAPDGTVWVVNQGSFSISVLNGTTGALVTTIALPYASRPYGVAFAPNGTYGYVTLQGTGQLVRMNPTTRAIVATLDVGPSPRGVAVSGDSSRIFLTRFVSPAARGEIREVSSTSFTVARVFTLAADPGPDAESSGRGVPNYVSSVAISPDGRRAWVPSKKDNTGRGQLRDGQRLTFESTVRTVASQVDLTTNTELISQRIDLNDRDMAQVLAFSKHGDYVFIVTQGSNTIDVFDAYNHQVIGGASNTGLAPQGVAFSADHRKVFVNAFMGRSVAIYDVAGFLDGSSTAVTLVGTVSTVAAERLSSQVLQGKRIFYNAADRRMNLDHYISCASCHVDGESDERVWDFTQRGEGLRNTISLLGHRGTSQGRVHWTASFDEIQDFENDVRGAFAGTGFMTDAQYNTGTRSNPLGDPKAGVSADLDALAAYVTSLNEAPKSPFRNADGSLTSDGATGKHIFQQLGCNRCHSGADFTDSASGVLHDVGTIKASSGKRMGAPLTGLDTPTLKGVWASAPYLHDGSAATLMDVITTANPGDRHGVTSTLTASQKTQLVAYLQQIDENEAAVLLSRSVSRSSAMPRGPMSRALKFRLLSKICGRLEVREDRRGHGRARVRCRDRFGTRRRFWW